MGGELCTPPIAMALQLMKLEGLHNKNCILYRGCDESRSFYCAPHPGSHCKVEYRRAIAIGASYLGDKVGSNKSSGLIPNVLCIRWLPGIPFG